MQVSWGMGRRLEGSGCKEAVDAWIRHVCFCLAGASVSSNFQIRP